MRKTTKQTFTIFWRHARRYPWYLAVIVACLVGATAVESVIPFFYKRFFDLLAANQIPRPEIAGQLTTIIFHIFILWGFVWIFYRIERFCNTYFQPRVYTDIMNACFDYLQHHSYGFFINRFVGSLVRRANRFADAFEAIADRIMLDLLPMLLRALITAAVLWYWSPLLGALVAVWLIVFLAVNYFFAVYKLKYDIIDAAADTEVSGRLADTITNNVNIKVFTAFRDEMRSFQKLTEKKRKAWMVGWQLSGVIEAVQGGFMIVLEFLIMYVAIKLWNRGLLTIGDFALIQSYLIAMFRRLWEFWRVIRDIYKRLADAEEMTEILGMSHEVQDAPQARELIVDHGAVSFRDVHFTYTKTRDVIKDFSIVIKSGEKVGLVGPSGAGKSTLVSLIFRFFDVQSGGIYIDGQNIAEVTQDSLRRNLSLVPQDPLLFHRSLRENIRYGRRTATDEEVMIA
ncbi:MAG: ABC transporter ATP-binding protein, partial [Candidatus Sungiibacteriota bacterium]